MHELTIQQMEQLEGGWKRAVDYGCAAVGVGALFFAPLLIAGAACVGWAIGRLM
ncbi:hypothetical protein JW948_09560 [bacterium]|nr:hypothetical protein [bacterium]